MVLFHAASKKQPEQQEQDRVNEFFITPAQWEGRYPPDFQLELMDGTMFQLSKVIGTKLIVLNFFATWCGPCRAEMPELITYHEANKDKEFLLLGIDAEEDRKTVQMFLDEFKATYPVGIDRDGSIDEQYSIRGYPTTVVIGVDGTVKAYIVGPVSNANVAFDSYLAEASDDLASGKAITTEDYLNALSAQSALPGEKKKKKGKNNEELTGRPKEIATVMLCPCGCDDKVIDCKCKTAKNIKAALKTMDMEGKDDAEIIRELNKEFCVGNDKS